ncbi:MAG: cytochrome c1 [Pseudomonadota bacterium]
MNIFANLKYGLIIAAILGAAMANAAGDAKKPNQHDWPFAGPFGKFDRQAAQRGYQVYREVCSSCHGVKRIAYRNLAALGFSEGEIRTIAGDAIVTDGPNADGDMFERPGLPTDYMLAPFANENAGRAANNGKYPPDLSLMAKARPDGANYIHSLLTGYEATPSGVNMPDGVYYNPYYPGYAIAMAAPLHSEGQVEYADGTKATIAQMSYDLVNFLQWAAEPENEARNSMGIQTMLYLFIITFLFYRFYKRTWLDNK